MTTYPTNLKFTFPNEPEKAGAVLQAALDLQLPFETDGPRIVVQVDSPMTAYRFGVRTQQALLQIAARKRRQKSARGKRRAEGEKARLTRVW